MRRESLSAMSSTVSRLFVSSVGDVLLLVSYNLSRITGITYMIEKSSAIIDNCPSRRSCMIGMPDCSWLRGRWECLSRLESVQESMPILKLILVISISVPLGHGLNLR